MSNQTDENVGKRIGIYNIVGVCDKKTNDGHKLYHVECVFCGWESDMMLSTINRATICKHIGIGGRYIKNIKWSSRRIGNIFKGMKSRCYNENDKDYKNYGGKGIRICDEWMDNPKSFEKWSIENGYADNLTIDRVDGNKNYCPENCRWITLAENAINKPTTNMINVDGEIHTGKEWSRRLGLGENQINKYIRKNGIENVTEFIHRYLNNPTLKPKHKQSFYDLYMSNNTIES